MCLQEAAQVVCSRHDARARVAVADAAAARTLAALGRRRSRLE